MAYPDYLTTNYSTNLMAYWKLNDSSAPFQDTTANNYDTVGIGTNAPSYNQAVTIPGDPSGTSCRTAAATSNYIALEDAGTNTRYGLSAWTIAIWFKRMGAGSYGASGTGTGGMLAEPLMTKGGAEAEALGQNMNWGMGLLQAIDPDGSTHDWYLAADYEKDDTNSATWATGRNCRMQDVSTSGTTVTTRTDPTASSTARTHGYADNDRVLFGGTAVSGITAGRFYYIVNATGSTFSVASTEGGSAISLGTVAAGGGAWINHAKMTNGNTGITSSDQNWHFAVNTWDGTNLKCYLDGVLVENEVPTCVPPENVSTQRAMISGYGTTTATVNGYFNGYLQHATIWSAALSASAITNLYNEGMASQTISASLSTTDNALPTTSIVVQLSDTTYNINDATVTKACVVLKKDNVTQVEGDDYAFSYSASTDQITLTPLKRTKFAPGVYQVILN